jgi:hypothetical protein
MTANLNCFALGDCHEVRCNYGGPVLHGVLSVQSCEDPVQVVLLLVGRNFTWSHTLDVTGELEHSVMKIPTDSPVYTTYSRNVSHLLFEVRASLNKKVSLP